MDDAASPSDRAATTSGRRSRRPRPAFAALDLGTNNCRLLIAEPAGSGFRIVDSYSQIVRLGEGLASSGRLGEAAIRRTMAALAQCARKIETRDVVQTRCVATQACRSAANGADFLAEVERTIGLRLDVISAEEEARLAVAGCAALLDPDATMGLIVDIGGGSTELSFVDPRRVSSDGELAILGWMSAPFGVVTLAERFGDALDQAEPYAALVAEIAEILAASDCARFAPAFVAPGAHLIGTSGTVTSLAGVHLGLARYQRAKVDGLWMDMRDVRAAAAALRAAGPSGRAANACIGPDRADLVAPGAAIVEAVARIWPAERIRVADRGLREGMLLGMMAQAGALRRAPWGRRDDR